MLSQAEAEKVLKDALQMPIEAGVLYRDVYLFRVTYPTKHEAGYDPFFSVHAETGEVRDFSVMHDGNISEIAQLFAETRR